MVNMESAFPRGFAYATHSFYPPSGFVEAPVVKNLWVDPWLKVDASTYKGLFVVVLGEASFQRRGLDRPSSELLKSLLRGEGSFFETLKVLAGRYAVLFGSPSDFSVVSDAAATRSVFYSQNGGVLASHASLVEYILGGSFEKSSLPFRNGYPGNFTPYARTKILTANLMYRVNRNEIVRYWPTTELPECSVEEAAEHTILSAANALKQLANERKIAIAMTAGFDSRLALAAAVKAGIEFETFTYGEKSKDTRVDRMVAQELAELVGVSHSVPPVGKSDPKLAVKLDEANYGSHHKKWVSGMSAHFGNPQIGIVSGNLMELGRGHYTDVESQGLIDASNPSVAAQMYLKRFPKRIKLEIDETVGLSKYIKIAEGMFAQWLDEIGGLTPNLLPGVTQFYWEHRMATWYGPAMLERDFYGESFIPFNSHAVFEVLLGVEKSKRESNETFIRAINSVDDRLLKIHVNPKTWPTTEPLDLKKH